MIALYYGAVYRVNYFDLGSRVLLVVAEVVADVAVIVEDWTVLAVQLVVRV